MEYFLKMVTFLFLSRNLALGGGAMVDGSTLLDVGHLPHTGHSIQQAGHLATSPHTATGAIQTPFKYSQVMMLES